MSGVEVAPVPGRVGQRVRNELIFENTGGSGSPAHSTYKLDIVIKENVTTKTSVYWPKTLTRLQAGSGTDDIQAIEIGNVTEAVQTQGDKFVDLGKEVDKSQWLDWKNQQATTKDGKLIGLGTDIGPMAICYRKDLFEKAGLETDRTAAGVQVEEA